MDTSGSEAGDQGSLSSWNSDIGIPIHFQKMSGIVTIWSLEIRVALEVSKWYDSPYPDEAENYGFLSGLHRGYRHAFILWDETRAWIKPLQGNPAFFWVRVSRGPFHLRQKTQGTSHIPIAEGKLNLRCWSKVGSNLQSKTGNELSTWDYMRCMELSSSCCTDINIHIDLRRVSQGISVDSSRKSSHLYCMLWNTG